MPRKKRKKKKMKRKYKINGITKLTTKQISESSRQKYANKLKKAI